MSSLADLAAKLGRCCCGPPALALVVGALGARGLRARQSEWGGKCEDEGECACEVVSVG